MLSDRRERRDYQLNRKNNLAGRGERNLRTGSLKRLPGDPACEYRIGNKKSSGIAKTIPFVGNRKNPMRGEELEIL